MDKIKGFTRSEVLELAAEAEKAKNGNGRLSDVFDAFAKKHNRARGSVRNFYYEFMRMCDQSPSLSEKYFVSRPPVNRARAFSEDEEKMLVEKILAGRRDNKSVRRTIIELAGGDEKLTLRYQNKYRNILKNDRELISRTAEDLGLQDEELRRACSRVDENSMRKLKAGINALVENIARSVREECKELKRRNALLENENRMLRTVLGKVNSEKLANNSDIILN